MHEELFGFTRTVCACEQCIEKCRHMSGMIIPEDLQRWKPLYDHPNSRVSFDEWCLAHLAASPGAIVVHQGEVKRIPTLVPRRRASGRCHWLMDNDRCYVHGTAPYGCGYFDHTQTKAEGDVRVMEALRSILEDWNSGGLYGRIWLLLRASGVMVEGPEIARQQMQKELQ